MQHDRTRIRLCVEERNRSAAHFCQSRLQRTSAWLTPLQDVRGPEAAAERVGSNRVCGNEVEALPGERRSPVQQSGSLDLLTDGGIVFERSSQPGRGVCRRVVPQHEVAFLRGLRVARHDVPGQQVVVRRAQGMAPTSLRGRYIVTRGLLRQLPAS